MTNGIPSETNGIAPGTNGNTSLIPCPFCGGEARLVEESGVAFGWCPMCNVSTRPSTDERVAVERWNTRCAVTGDTSDGYHTFDELYHHRAVLFSVIVSSHRGIAWKARRHHDGTMYEGMFIVGLDTPWGQASYHYDIDPYWGMFDCDERESAPEWDGHTPDEAIERIGKLAGCAVADRDFAMAVHDGSLWGKCSECEERQKHYLDAETIQRQQEHVAELETEASALRVQTALQQQLRSEMTEEAECMQEMVEERDGLIRDMWTAITWMHGMGDVKRDELRRRIRDMGIDLEEVDR